MAKSIAFWTSDGKSSNLTREVRDAYSDEPFPIIVPDAGGGGGGAGVAYLLDLQDDDASLPPDPGESLDESAVEALLSDSDQWAVVVRNDDHRYVLTKDMLAEGWDAFADGTAILPLRDALDSEETLLDDAAKLLGPAGSFERLKESIGFPIGTLSAIATAAGLFGFVAIEDKIVRPWAIGVTCAFAILAMVVSLFGRYSLTASDVRFNRIDEVRARLDALLSGITLTRSRIALGALAVALAFAVVATYPASEDTASASVGEPSTSHDSDGAKPHVKVTWKHLPDSVKSVRTTVMQGSANVGGMSSDRTDEDLVQEFDVTKPVAKGSYTVTTEALDKDGRPMGAGFQRSFTVQ